MNKQGAIAGMIAGIGFTAAYIIWFRLLHPELSTAENWLFGISPEGIGTVGMLINFVVAIAIYVALHLDLFPDRFAVLYAVPLGIAWAVTVAAGTATEATFRLAPSALDLDGVPDGVRPRGSGEVEDGTAVAAGILVGVRILAAGIAASAAVAAARHELADAVASAAEFTNAAAG